MKPWRRILAVILLLTLAVAAQDGDFEVRGGALPSTWTGGPERGASRRFEAHRREDNPSLWGQVDVLTQTPSTLEQLKANQSPHSDSAETSWETGRLHNYATYTYHVRESSDILIERDEVYVALSERVWAHVTLDRSCSLTRAVMQDGSEIPPDTVPMVYERKFIPVDAEAQVSQLRSEEDAILQSLEFVLDGSPPGSEELPEIPWATVVGGGVAVVVAAALVAAARKKPPARPSRPEPEKEKSQKRQDPSSVYVLQLNADRLEVPVSPPASLIARVWQVEPATGTYRPVPDAVLEVIAPQEVQVATHPSPGTLTCELVLAGPTDLESATLTVQARAGGSLHEAQVRLHLAGQVTMEFF